MKNKNKCNNTSGGNPIKMLFDVFTINSKGNGKELMWGRDKN